MRSVTVTELDIDGVGSQVKNGTTIDQWGRRHSEKRGPELKKRWGHTRADGESGWQEKQGRHASPPMGLPSPTSGKNEH